MSHFAVVLSSITLILLIVLAAFFSAAETGLMAINRYRLRHQARLKKRSAMIILHLLKRPDRLLGLILIGNNCANIVASALATVLALHILGEKAVIMSTVLLTVIVLVFAEVAPKTLAALYPERISKLVAWPVLGLLKLFYPVVWLLNAISNGLLRLFGVQTISHTVETLTREELRSLVYETAGRVSGQYQDMLLGILDLNKITVDHVMIPHHQVVGLDLTDDWQIIRQQLAQSEYDWLPVYRENINQIEGVLHLRDVMHATLEGKSLDKESLLSLVQEPYFIPEGTTLNTQLIHFQRQRKRLALVVDEYGEIQGLLTLEDILEEIVGEFTTNVMPHKKIEKEAGGSYLVDGAITVRELNRITGWQLPLQIRTLSGLIIEYLEAIPREGVTVKIANHPIEIIEVEENRVKVARIFPPLTNQ